jgi:hypothetical protein
MLQDDTQNDCTEDYQTDVEFFKDLDIIVLG